jgi:hypothetical protein
MLTLAFSSLGVLLEYGLRKFPDISYFTYLRQARNVKKIPQTVLKTKLKPKETLWSHSEGILNSFLEFSLRSSYEPTIIVVKKLATSF